MKEQVNKELQNAQTWNEIFAVLNKHYNLDVKLGTMSKAAVLMGLDNALKMTNTKPRE